MLAPLELTAKSGKPWLLLLTKSDLGRGTGVAPDKDWRAPEAVISLSSVTHEGSKRWKRRSARFTPRRKAIRPS